MISLIALVIVTAARSRTYPVRDTVRAILAGESEPLRQFGNRGAGTGHIELQAAVHEAVRANAAQRHVGVRHRC